MPLDIAVDWHTTIQPYLEHNILPSNKNEARKVIRRAGRFFLWGGSLYGKGFSSPCLKCVSPEDANYVLRETHKGMCRSHQGRSPLKRKQKGMGIFGPPCLRKQSTWSENVTAARDTRIYPLKGKRTHDHGLTVVYRHIGNGHTRTIPNINISA